MGWQKMAQDLLETAIHFIEKHKTTYADLYGVDLSDVRVSFQGSGNRNETLMSFLPPKYIFVVVDHPEREELCKPPFARIEYASLHELGHAFFEKIPRNKWSLLEETTFASEGFTQVLNIDCLIPSLNSESLSKIAQEDKQSILRIVDIIEKEQIDMEKFAEYYNKDTIFKYIFSYSLFHRINSELGMEGLMMAAKDIPEFKDYLPGDNGYIARLKSAPAKARYTRK